MSGYELAGNISAAREQCGLERLQLKCSMGRMECYKRDAYHVGKHSRPTPRLAHIINCLFGYLFTYLLSDRYSFSRALASFHLFWNNYFEFTVLCWNVLSECGHRDLRAV